MSKNTISDKVLCAEYEAVYLYILSLCHNDSLAQDITQEAFYKALNARHRFKGGSSLYTWLCSIAKNIWLNKCKKDNRITIEDSVPNMKDDNNFISYLEDRDSVLEIHKILHILEEPYKEVFTLRVFGELPFSDIANLFSKTESWARVTFHRSKKIILNRLTED